MGYNVSGDFFVTVTEKTAIQAALMKADMPPALLGFLDGEDDIIEDVITNGLFVDINGSVTDVNGTTQISGYFADKWSNVAEEALRWLATVGCGIEGTVVGEDNAAWEYATPAEHGTLVELSLEYVRAGGAELAGPAATLVEACATVNITELDLPEPIRAALLDLLAKAGTGRG